MSDDTRRRLEYIRIEASAPHAQIVELEIQGFQAASAHRFSAGLGREVLMVRELAPEPIACAPPRGKGRNPDETPTVPFGRCPVCGRLVELPARAVAMPGTPVTCPWCQADLEVTPDGQGLKRRTPA